MSGVLATYVFLDRTYFCSCLAVYGFIASGGPANVRVFLPLATSSVVRGPAALSSPGSLLIIQNLGP